MRRIRLTRKKKISFHFGNQKINCNEGESIASALLASGEHVFRVSHQSGSNRGPYCMMGVCFECLVEIDGSPNRQACMTIVSDGMKVTQQNGPANLGFLEKREGEIK